MNVARSLSAVCARAQYCASRVANTKRSSRRQAPLTRWARGSGLRVCAACAQFCDFERALGLSGGEKFSLFSGDLCRRQRDAAELALARARALCLPSSASAVAAHVMAYESACANFSCRLQTHPEFAPKHAPRTETFCCLKRRYCECGRK